QDVLTATVGLDEGRHRELKRVLHRIVSMLTRLISRSQVVSESPAEYEESIEYEYRDAEHEYKYDRDKPEPLALTSRGVRSERGEELR
ncbi:MAG: hypothetical protein RIK87_02545, partial [Fuerstiella sp.]